MFVLKTVSSVFLIKTFFPNSTFSQAGCLRPPFPARGRCFHWQVPLEARAGLGAQHEPPLEPGLGLNTETSCFWALEVKGKTERGACCRPAAIPRSRAVLVPLLCFCVSYPVGGNSGEMHRKGRACSNDGNPRVAVPRDSLCIGHCYRHKVTFKVIKKLSLGITY